MAPAAAGLGPEGVGDDIAEESEADADLEGEAAHEEEPETPSLVAGDAARVCELAEVGEEGEREHEQGALGTDEHRAQERRDHEPRATGEDGRGEGEDGEGDER